MPAFEYEALDADGRSRRGILTAETARQARSELRRRAMTPVAISDPKTVPESPRQPGGPVRLRPDELVIATRQLAVLVGAAIPLEEALNDVALQTMRQGARKRLLAVRERVLEGQRFAEGLADDPKSFPGLYRSVVAAGETSGDLAGVLARLATMLEKNRSMQSKAIASLIYPLVLMLVAIGVVTALMTVVVPKIVVQFNAFDSQLPFITRFVVGASEALAKYGFVAFAVLAVGAIVLVQVRRNPSIKVAIDRRALSLPIVGGLMRGLDGARFARTLSTLVSGGAPLLDALRGANQTVTNAFIRQRLEQATVLVQEGATLASALKRADALPPMMVHMAAAGERAGDIPVLLDKAAVQLEEQFDTASTVALRLLEPLIIVAMGGVVAMIVLAIMLPILQLNSLAAG